MNPEVIVLRLVHILGGIFWVGSGLFTSFFLMPAMTQAGAAAGSIIAGLQRRRLYTVLPIVAVLTILSGVRLMQIGSAGFDPRYFQSAVGQTYAISGLVSIIAFLLSLIVARPAFVRLGVLGQSLATATDDATRQSLTAQMNVVRRRGSAAAFASVLLVTAAAAGMAVARYLG